MLYIPNIWFLGIFFLAQFDGTETLFNVPIDVPDRHSTKEIKLTSIGNFGLLRKARPSVPAHYHTGIDIKRPRDNYRNEPIFPITTGVVISIKTNGPYAQLIIEHRIQGKKLWSLYEHIAGITVNISDTVHQSIPIARFMNRKELTKFGWQFDHVHLEVLKVPPIALKPDKTNSARYYRSYSLVCFTKKDLEKYFYNPLKLFDSNWKDFNE